MTALDLFDLSGRTAVVTGSSAGLGRAMAEGLLEAGANVVVTSRKPERVATTVEELGSDRVLGVNMDTTDEADVERLFDAAAERFGHVDVLVANAGTTWGAATVEMLLKDWEKVLATNLTGTFLAAREFGRRAIEEGRPGKLVVLSSVGGLVGIELFKTVGYAASKGGLVGLTKQLAVEWAPHGITVNVLAPGFFPTKMTEYMIEHHGAELRRGIPLDRWGSEDDAKGTIVYLSSRASDYMTGHILVLDGGQTAW